MTHADDLAALSEQINEKVATAGDLYDLLISLPREQAIDHLRDMLRVIAGAEAWAQAFNNAAPWMQA